MKNLYKKLCVLATLSIVIINTTTCSEKNSALKNSVSPTDKILHQRTQPDAIQKQKRQAGLYSSAAHAQAIDSSLRCYCACCAVCLVVSSHYLVKKCFGAAE